MQKINFNLLTFSFICCVFLLLLTGCDEGFDDIDETNNTNNTNIRAIEEYLNDIGTLPLPARPVKEFEKVELSRTTGSELMLSPPFVPKQDIYQRDLVEEQKTAFVPRSNNIPFKLDNNIWPGNLIQGASLTETTLSSVPLSRYRKPATVYLNVVSAQEDMEYSREITEVTGSQVNQAMNDIMSEHTNGLPAYVNYSQHTVRSQSEMAYWLDMSAEELEAQTGNAFSSVNWELTDKTYIMVKLEQIYFTMAIDDQALDDIFESDITLSEIEKYTGKGNPLCYISSVSYGRYFILLYECDSRVQNFDEIIDKIFNKENDTSLTGNERAIVNSNYVNMKMVQIGGNAEDGLNLIASPTYENFRNFVVNGSKFDKNNVGAPIYYNITYAHNGQSITSYKSLNTTYKNYEYYVVDNNNEVEITIKSIYSSKLVLKGGNWYTNHRSCFSVSDIKIFKRNDLGDWQLVRAIPSGIKDVNTTHYATNRSYFQKVNAGQFGYDKSSLVKISFTVTYTNVRGRKNGKVKDTQTRAYEEDIFFEYIPANQKWIVFKNPSLYNATRYVDFSTMSIADNFNFYNVNFNIAYTFEANQRIVNSIK